MAHTYFIRGRNFSSTGNSVTTTVTQNGAVSTQNFTLNFNNSANIIITDSTVIFRFNPGANRNNIYLCSLNYGGIFVVTQGIVFEQRIESPSFNVIFRSYKQSRGPDRTFGFNNVLIIRRNSSSSSITVRALYLTIPSGQNYFQVPNSLNRSVLQISQQ